MMKCREKQLLRLSSLLTVMLAVVIGLSMYNVPRDEVADDITVPFAAAIAQEESPQEADPTPTQTPMPVLSSEKDWSTSSNPAPSPLVTHIDCKISDKLYIDAEAFEPSVLSMLIAERVYVPYSHKTLPDLLFQDKQSKRTLENVGRGRYDTYNKKGEFLLVEPGRVAYSRNANKETRSEWAQVAGYLRQKKNEKKWLYTNQKELDQELSFLSRDEAGRQAVDYTLTMQPEGFPFTLEVENVAGITYSQWDDFTEALYKERYVKFKSIPREGDQDYGGDGLYLVTLRFYYQGVSVYMGNNLEYISYGRTTSRVQGQTGMDVTVLISAAGVIEYDAGYLCTFTNPTEVPILSLEQAVECMATEYKEFSLENEEDVRRFTIDRIYPVYIMLHYGDGKDSQFAWHPMWCFTDDVVEGGWLNGQPFSLYLDAVTGRSILTM